MRTMISVSERFKAIVPVLEQMFRVTEAAADVAAEDGPFDSMAWERVCSALGAAVEGALMGVVLAACDRSEPLTTPNGVVIRPATRSSTRFFSLRGPVEVTRSLYDVPGASARYDPVAARMNAVHKHWLPHAAHAMAFLVQQVPQRDAEAIAEPLGVLPYAHSSFWALTQAVGAQYTTHETALESARMAALAVPPEATGVVLSLDRVATAFEEPRARPRGRPRKGAPKKPIARVWHQPYCATVSLHDAQGKVLRTLRYGRMPNESLVTLCERLREDARILVRARPKLSVSVIFDGAKELWTAANDALCEAALGHAAQLLVDLWHLLEKVGKAMRARYDERRAKQEMAWWRLRLLNRDGAWSELLGTIQRWRKEEPKWRRERPIHDALTYLRNQGEAGRLEYARARREGRPVGSGPVEACCKTVVSVRFKRAGARWKMPSGAHVIRLRAAATSGGWDELMRELTRLRAVQVFSRVTA